MKIGLPKSTREMPMKNNSTLVTLEIASDHFVIKHHDFVAKGNTINEVLEEFKHKESAYLSEMQELQEEAPQGTSLTNNTHQAHSRKWLTSLRYLLARDIIVFCFIALLTLSAAIALKNSKQKISNSIHKTLNPTELKQEKYNKNLKSGLNKIRPYLKIIKEYWNEL